jgi:UDP-N-acetylglucosamine acyltransferase
VEVQDHAILGGFAGVHQFCRVGAHAFMGGGTVATRDVLPFSMTVGDRARLYGVNLVGLRRRGFSKEAIGALREAFRVLLRAGAGEGVKRLERDGPHTPEVAALVAFVREARRGVVLRPRAGVGEEDEEA